MIHEQINIIIIAIDRDMILPPDKSKSTPHFQQKISHFGSKRFFYFKFILQSYRSYETEAIRILERIFRKIRLKRR